MNKIKNKELFEEISTKFHTKTLCTFFLFSFFLASKILENIAAYEQN